MSIITIGLLVAGFVLLIAGAEALVRGSSRSAVALGISPLVVGLTVVAFGTSAPEIAVSVDSALRGQGDLAIGNVVGSNIFNILFVLGAAAIAAPLIVDRRIVRREVPIMIVAGFATLLMAIDGVLSLLEGALLVIGLVAFTFYMIRTARTEPAAAEESPAPLPTDVGGRWARVVDAALILGGLGLLAAGSHLLVNGASQLARAFGVSELIIGLTVVAAGTGLPEVATSIVAAVRGQRDIAVGNVVGSNIFNILAVLGVTGLVAPGVDIAPAARNFDIPVMVVTMLFAVPILFSGMRISRLEGLLFVSLYVAYVAYLVLDARGHDALPAFSSLMLFGVLPVAALIVVVIAVHSWITGARANGTRDAHERSRVYGANGPSAG